MKIKVSEASGPVLDWMVAKCEGAEFHCVDGVLCVLWSEEFDVRLTDYSPSTNWAQGGPIVEREKIEIRYYSQMIVAGTWYRDDIGSDECLHKSIGPTPLIAAMRCYVASKLGEEVEVPDDLI